MDFHLLRDVRQRDGGKLGELRHVVCDPNTQTVLSLVVQHVGLAGTAVVVPIGAVERSDEDAVYLTLFPEQFDRLEKYAYGQNVAPPPAEYDPSTVSEDFPQELLDVPNVPPVGAAEGITSIAFTPLIAAWLNVPEGSAVIDDATAVSAQDGDIGYVKHVLTDDQGNVSGFVVEKGFLFTKDIEVPLSWVQELRSGSLDLNVSKAEVAGAQTST
jgi:uncharacterized protein YrrD